MGEVAVVVAAAVGHRGQLTRLSRSRSLGVRSRHRYGTLGPRLTTFAPKLHSHSGQHSRELAQTGRVLTSITLPIPTAELSVRIVVAWRTSASSPSRDYF